MTDERGAEHHEQTVPPAPAEAAMPAATSVPLAPPLVAPQPPAYAPQPPAYAPQLPAAPPYASPAQQPPRAGQQYAGPPYSGQPHPGQPTGAPLYYQPTPPASRSGGKLAAIVVGSVAVFILIVTVAVVALFSWASQDPTPGAAGGEVATQSPSDDPATSGDGRDSDTTAAEGIAAELENKIAEYKLARDNGSLWEKIPDTEFNRTAVSAFLYLLTDMKVATIWGIDEDTAQEYAAEMTHLEELLLAEQPLGSDIEIVLSDRTFRYNGDTGEGGYSDE